MQFMAIYTVYVYKYDLFAINKLSTDHKNNIKLIKQLHNCRYYIYLHTSYSFIHNKT